MGRNQTSYGRNGVLLIGRGVAYHKTDETDLLQSNGGPVDREGCGVPQNGGNGPPTVETGVLLIGRGVAYRKMEETDLLRSKRGLVDREGCGVPQNGGNGPPTVETGSCSSGGVWRTAKRDCTGYCSSPPSTSSSLHGLLFIHSRPPPASTGSCSSSLHHSSTGYCSTSPLHGGLFNHLSTGYCSSSPPPHHGILFIQRQCHRSLFIPEAVSIGFS